MRKIAVITRYFPSSGEPAQGRSLYETLRVVGRSAGVRVFYPNATYPAVLRPRSRTYDRLDLDFRPPDVDVGYFNYPALPLISRPLNGWTAARILLPHVRAYAPDLVFGCFLYPEGFAALKIGRALGIPIVVMSIGTDLNGIGGFLAAKHVRAVVRQADYVVTVCDDLRKKAVAMGAAAAKTRTILNGCDLEIFCPRDRSEARKKLGIDPLGKTVVYVGRMDLKKGLRELVDAAAALHPERPGLHCYLVGRGPDRSAIEEAIQAREASSYVHLVPGCAFNEVAVWMAAADLVTLPSYMEGCPNVVIEALACGRPVVATNVGGTVELVSHDCGQLVPPHDSRFLSQALASVLDRPWDPAKISMHLNRSWSAPAAELLEVFEALLANGQEDIRVR